MIFEIGCELEYTAKFPSTLILSIYAQRNASQTIRAEHFAVEPKVATHEFVAEGGGNRFLRLETGKHKKLNLSYAATVEVDCEDHPAHSMATTPIAELDSAALPYLFPSRYCQSDRLGKLAWDLFGAIEKPYDRVIAIADWTHDNVEYVRGTTTSETSAYDTVTQRVGVCRDFAHLGIALCRALNIPARYFTGYAYELEPPDLHACFECYIGGTWMVFDATRLAHLNGLVRIATGRDAADTAVASVFGSAACSSMTVRCELGAGEEFHAIPRRKLARRGVALPTQTG